MLDAIQATLAETRVDPKAYAVGILTRNAGPTDPLDAADRESKRLMDKWDADPDSAPWAGAI